MMTPPLDSHNYEPTSPTLTPRSADLGIVTGTPTDPWATYSRDSGTLPSFTKSRGTSSHCYELADVDRHEVGAAGPVGSGLVEVGEQPGPESPFQRRLDSQYVVGQDVKDEPS
jgi:hypothetical protein